MTTDNNITPEIQNESTCNEKKPRATRARKYANHDEYIAACRQKTKEWKLKNREKALAYNIQYYKDNGEKIRKQVSENQKKKTRIKNEKKANEQLDIE